MRIWISAGEVSGDRLAARLVESFRGLDPGLEFEGLAGPFMEAAGVRSRGDAMDFAVAGWTSVAAGLPRLALAGWRALRAAKAFLPDLAIVVDAPGLHRPIVRSLRREGIRCVWLAPPQLWAWKDRVVPELRGMDVYPLHGFEAPALARCGAFAHWLGFPGPRPIGAFARERTLLALLPGARPHWRRRHEPLFREAAALAGLPLETVVAIPDGFRPGPGEREVSELLPEAALALALPGTGALEAALAGVPTVVAARPGWLDAAIARRRLSAGSLSLPNRILGEDVFPERLGAPTASGLASDLRDLRDRREAVVRSLARLPDAMGPRDAMDRIALHMLGRRV